MSRKCVKCKKVHEDLTKYCPTCKEYARVYREANKEDIAVKKAAYYEENKEDIAVKKTVYREKNKEVIAAKGMVYYQENKEDITIKRAEYYEDNKEDIRARQTAYKNTQEGKMKQIKQSAKERKKIITITDDEIINMTDLPCVYCGTETIDAAKRNGIDRLDSSKGYALDNCVPCCHMCNMMKGEVDPLTFVERCAHISYVNGGQGQLTEHWSHINMRAYARYKWTVIKRKVIFELAKEEYEELRAQNCEYCHRPSLNDHFNGIDRVDPDIGYISTNCVSCCRDCNMMKRSYSVKDFLKQCKKITNKEHVFLNVPRVLSTFTCKND